MARQKQRIIAGIPEIHIALTVIAGALGLLGLCFVLGGSSEGFGVLLLGFPVNTIGMVAGPVRLKA